MDPKNIKPQNTFSLTPRMVRKLMKRIFPRAKVGRIYYSTPGIDVYGGRTGPHGLVLKCENDWKPKFRRGRIRVSVFDEASGQKIVQYYWPDTLDLDTGRYDEQEVEP